jgi:hypothetical protein
VKIYDFGVQHALEWPRAADAKEKKKVIAKSNTI